MGSIQDVKSMRSRALLRGLLDREADTSQIRSTISNLLGSVSAEDFRAVDALLRDSTLFRHLEIPPEFPRSTPFHGQHNVSFVPSGAIPQYIAYRIEKHAVQLALILRRFHELNVATAARVDADIVRSIEAVVDSAGHSLMLARKMAYVIGYLPRETLSFLHSTETVALYGLNERNYGVMATIDSIGSEFNYLSLRARFQSFISTEAGASIPQKVSYLSFFPVTLHDEAFSASINASYEVSLIDAVISFLAHRAMGVASAQHRFPQELEESWNLISDGEKYWRDLFLPRDAYCDFQAFRAAPAFLEFDRLRSLRATMQPLYDLPELRRRHDAARSLASIFFAHANSLADLISNEPIIFDPVPERFDRNTAAELVRTSGFIWVAEKDADFSSITASAMASLMGGTTGLDRLLPSETLRRGAASATDPFVKLLLLTMLRAHSAATRDNYDFKEYFQRYVNNRHGGDILSFLQEVHALEENIVPYFVNLLDETMLSQMPFLVGSSNAVYETRASLLEWHAVTNDHPESGEKAKQLRIDRKIAKIRDAINETRLNIDAIRFRQWIEQSIITEFSDFIRQTSPNLPTLTDWSDKAKHQAMVLAAHREPATRALLAIFECYAEFCRNPDYGVASFLGRRIRHGTLRGTLLDGVQSPSGAVPSGFTAQYQAWASDFSTRINAFAARLHFKDKAGHKNGIISAEIDSPQKRQACLACLKSIFDQAQQDKGILHVPLVIEQFCWFIFELELAHVQDLIAEARGEWGVVRLRHQPTDTDAISFEKKMNMLLNDRFNTVSSWFRKPPNLSPVAELGHVLDVVLKEARGEYANFNPLVHFEGDKELKLRGRIIYVVYDALTIAVRNAAKHGAYPGQLSIATSLHETEMGSTLELAISSELKAEDQVTAVIERLSAAAKVGAHGADIVEGRSGIRKLTKMQAEQSIVSFSVDASSEHSEGVCVKIAFPYTGLT